MKMRTILFKCALLPALLAFAVSANALQAAQKNAQGAANDAQTPAPSKRIKRVAKKKVEPKEVAPPSLDDRLTEHRLAVRKGEDREPSSAYLIEEVTVTGTYKSVEGYGAFLRASNSRTFFGYKGMPFYDGVILQIDPDQVVFQQNQPDGKKKQIVKSYDPSSLRSATVNEKAEREKKEKNKEKKAKKDEPKKDEEEGDPTDDEE